MISYQKLENLRGLVDFAKKIGDDQVVVTIQTVEDLLGAIATLQRDGQNAAHVVDERGKLKRELADWRGAVVGGLGCLPDTGELTPQEAFNRISWLQDEGGKVRKLRSQLKVVNDIVATMKGI